MVTKTLTEITRNKVLPSEEDRQSVKIPAWLVKALSPRKTFRMLVPLDGSEVAEEALKHLIGLDEKFGGKASDIILLRVIEPFAPPFRYPPKMQMDFKEYLEYEKRCAFDICTQYLAKIQKKMDRSGITCRYMIQEGMPAEAISNYALKNGVDLIVISSHGRKGLHRWVFGSIAEKVIRSAACPVFVIRGLNRKSIVLHANVV